MHLTLTVGPSTILGFTSTESTPFPILKIQRQQGNGPRTTAGERRIRALQIRSSSARLLPHHGSYHRRPRYLQLQKVGFATVSITITLLESQSGMTHRHGARRHQLSTVSRATFDETVQSTLDVRLSLRSCEIEFEMV